MIVKEVSFKQASNGKEFVKVVTDEGSFNSFDEVAIKKVKENSIKGGDEVKIKYTLNGKYKNFTDIEVLSTGNAVPQNSGSDNSDSAKYWKEKHELDKKRLKMDVASKHWFLYTTSFDNAVKFYSVQAGSLDAVIEEDKVFELAKKIYEEAKNKAVTGGKVE